MLLTYLNCTSLICECLGKAVMVSSLQARPEQCTAALTQAPTLSLGCWRRESAFIKYKDLILFIITPFTSFFLFK
jgi:hypothetical protein